MEVTLAVTHSIGDMNLKRPPSVARQEPQWSDRDSNPPTKLSTQNVSCLQETQDRMEHRLSLICYVSQGDELMANLSQFPECWNYRHVPPLLYRSRVQVWHLCLHFAFASFELLSILINGQYMYLH
ncbi:rCG56853, isoform CRA_b [Rattus norvegicus]|uniref:RCG56853, isoform CRA_b n=1 Tax=Rattus norvegicus TaxID=10116 RepID=A6KNV2_RAT|nr:rCG56853, isoform CRA_b [Rattus norvegicus]EDL87994.1 rCG56853, isoform CRA_b [Rattus norvegicus]EDL87995.1 rCG56853, isoform CRA_b [Rattus norvegicus]EDL87996.1 rCG56853, isoform CRA_b [Rattus norvegicus]